MRLIDADKLYPDCLTKTGRVAISQSQIAEAPTVERPTVCGNNSKWCENCVSKGKCASTRPHGEWIEHYDSSDGFTWLTCSRCMFKAYEEDYSFCPNCGADMRKEKKYG